MIVPTKLVKGGILAVLLIGASSAVSAKTAPTTSSLALKPALATRPSSALSSVPSTTELDDVIRREGLARSVVEKTRGGDDGEEVSLVVRLKILSYFALWYILNIVYNSEYSPLPIDEAQGCFFNDIQAIPESRTSK